MSARLRSLVLCWLRQPRWLRAGPPLLLAVLLWTASAQRGSGQPPALVLQLLHNAAHVVAYAALGGLVLLALSSAGGSLARHLPAALVLAVGYGAADEVHQSFVPQRHGSVADFCSDASGAALACCLLLLLLQGDRRALAALPWLGLLAAAAVAAATFLPL